MTETKRTSDFSNRLKRPLKSTSRTSKSPASSSISAPPKAAIATPKPKKDDIHRRKTPFSDMLRSRPTKDAVNSSPSTADEHEPDGEQDATRTAPEDETKTQGSEQADRMVELERVLAHAREEQDRLREELEKVKNHGHIQVDAPEDSPCQSPVLHERRSDLSPHRASHDEDNYYQNIGLSPRRSTSTSRHDELIDQNQALRTQVSELQDHIMQQDALHEAAQARAPPRDSTEWQELTIRLHNTEKESQERLQQLLDLKHSISALTRMDNQITDSDITEQIDQLYHRVREFVVSNFRRTKLHFSNADAEVKKVLHSIYPNYENIDSSDRLAFYQALVSHGIMVVFREPIYLGLPDSGPLSSIRQLAKYICNDGPEYHEWRRTTIRALEKSDAETALRQERQNIVHRIANDIQLHLFSLTSINLTAHAQSTLVGIINSAAEIQQSLLLQKAQYTVHFFHNQDGNTLSFNGRKMEDVNDIDSIDDDGDMFMDRPFAFCVFPCLEKFGDEFGERQDVSNVLLKAKVCCGVG